METFITLNYAHCSLRVINFSSFLETSFSSKSTLGCYIVKTTASVASNDALYEK